MHAGGGGEKKKKEEISSHFQEGREALTMDLKTRTPSSDYRSVSRKLRRPRRSKTERSR